VFVGRVKLIVEAFCDEVDKGRAGGASKSLAYLGGARLQGRLPEARIGTCLALQNYDINSNLFYFYISSHT
jgi:hypothetical protein